MVIEESDLKFEFNEDYQVVKFDDTDFYRREFNKLPAAKGVDIIANSKEVLQFIEVKNCVGHESENLWRTSVNNSKIESAPRELKVEDRDSLDIEVAKKIASSLSCLAGAWTKAEHMDKAEELVGIWKGLNDTKIPTDRKKIVVVLFLEGDFCSWGPKSRNKKMMMQRIQESLNAKLSWLNCRVQVVDSNTYKPVYFKVS